MVKLIKKSTYEIWFKYKKKSKLHRCVFNIITREIAINLFESGLISWRTRTSHQSYCCSRINHTYYHFKTIKTPKPIQTNQIQCLRHFNTIFASSVNNEGTIKMSSRTWKLKIVKGRPINIRPCHKEPGHTWRYN